MTGQSLLDAMEVLNQELQLQTGEADVVRGLTALNMAQDYFESLVAQEGSAKGDTTGTVTTDTGIEISAFPTGFLRIDKIQYIDPTTTLPKYDLENLDDTGTHAFEGNWPFNSSNTRGIPEAYFTNGRYIYWDVFPSSTHTMRVYGFRSADDITASGTFAYDDNLRLPFAAFAVRLMKLGVGDDVGDVTALAKETFGSSLAAVAGFNRTGASSLIYSQVHNA